MNTTPGACPDFVGAPADDAPVLPQPQETETHLDAFQRLVVDPQNQLPNPDFDLYVLAIGFFLGRGVNLAQAYELANEARFENYYLD